MKQGHTEFLAKAGSQYAQIGQDHKVERDLFKELVKNGNRYQRPDDDDENLVIR